MFFDPNYSANANPPSRTDGGLWTAGGTFVHRWVLKAEGDLAVGKAVSAYVRSNSGTYGGTTGDIKFYNGGTLISTTAFGATDADGGRAINNLTIPATTLTIQIDHYPAASGDHFEMHVVAGVSTAHLRYASLNKGVIIEDRSLRGVKREVRGDGQAARLVNIPDGTFKTWAQLIAARSTAASPTSYTAAEQAALLQLIERMRISGLMDKAIYIHPFVGTGLGCLQTPLLDRFGHGRLRYSSSLTPAWNPLLGLRASDEGGTAVQYDTGIVPSTTGAGRDAWGHLQYGLTNKSADFSGSAFGMSTASTTFPVTSNSGMQTWWASLQLHDNPSPTNGGRTQGNIGVARGTGSGLVTDFKTAGTHIAARSPQGTGILSFNGQLTGEGGSMPLDPMGDETIKFFSSQDNIAMAMLFNQPLQLWEHALLHRFAHEFNRYPGVRTSPPAIAGDF